MSTVSHSDGVEGQTGNAVKNKYDIFDTSTEEVEDNLRRNWLDRCHGCLRLFFLLSLAVFILITAFLSRFSFHIILINLNPPTIFTSLNKFGGDTVNQTLPFEPAEVHITWVWACFLVLAAPSVHVFLHHVLRICKNGNMTDKSNGKRITNHKKEKFICCNTFPIQRYHEDNEVDLNKSKRDSVDDKKDEQTKIENNSDKDEKKKKESDPENVDKGPDNDSQSNQTETENDHPVRLIVWISIIGILQALLESLAVFVLLPTFDQASASIISTSMTLLVPLFFNGLYNPYFRCHGMFSKDYEGCLIRLLKGVMVGMAIIVLCLLLVYLRLISAEEAHFNSVPGLYVLLLILIVCMSCGFWENVSGFLIERHRYRDLTFSVMSFGKILVYFFTLLAIVGVTSHGSNVSGVRVLFGTANNATITMLEKNILLISSLSFRDDCSARHPFYVALVSLGASYLCFKACYQACRTYLQWQSFSIPLLSNLVFLPLMVGFFLDPNAFYSKIGDCEIISRDWDFIVDGKFPSKIVMGFCGVFTFLSVVMLTTYIWRSGMRIKKLERIFAMPFYTGYAVDISLLWSKRVKRKKNNDPGHEKQSTIPFIYLCATMWHESEIEMKTLLRSIFRLNKHQFTMTVKQNYLHRPDTRKEADQHFYQFEAHIFFDDALKENKEKNPTENGKNNKKKFKQKPGEDTNEFVSQFIKCVEDTARSFYGIEEFSITKKYKTPYGGRLEWDLLVPDVDDLLQESGRTENPSSPHRDQYLENLCTPCKLILHLKDKFLIRNKKRWSQVMYMYYLLSYIPISKQSHKEAREDSEIASTSAKSPESNIKLQDDVTMDKKRNNFLNNLAPNTFILALDGDVDFKPDAVLRLLERMQKNKDVGAACGRIIPMGGGPVVWYQKFEYAASHWLQKAAEHVFGCVLCSPGCFSLFRASALMSTDIIKVYTDMPTSGFEYIQYDQGEDRWLSTLLLKQGYKLEYTATSDANTFVPEGFFEFFNQRRRWSPSTLANIFDIISNVSMVSKRNNYVSKIYLFYQMFLFAASIITPGTIFLMVLGATVLAFPDIPTWLAFTINFVLVGIVMLSCVFAEEKHQLTIMSVISAMYALVMVVVLFGLIIDAVTSGFCSVTTYFFCYVAGIFLIAAILHPMEFSNIIYGVVYFLAVPTTSMLLLIYALGNLHVTSWGTRESNKPGKRRKQLLDEANEKSCSCFGLCRCTCLPSAIQPKKRRKDKAKRQNTVTENNGKEESPKTSNDNQEVKKEFLLDNADDIERDEKVFWREIIPKYLSPMIKEDATKRDKLIKLRDSVYAGFVFINLIYIIIVFVVTQANDLNNNIFTIRLPCPNRSGSFDVDPISVVFTISFGFVLFFQLIGMIIHRFSTFTHIVAVSKIFEKSLKFANKKCTEKQKTKVENKKEGTKKEETRVENKKEHRPSTEKKWHLAIQRIFNNKSMGDRKRTMKERGKSEFKKSLREVMETIDESQQEDSGSSSAPDFFAKDFSGSITTRPLAKRSVTSSETSIIEP